MSERDRQEAESERKEQELARERGEVGREEQEGVRQYEEKGRVGRSLERVGREDERIAAEQEREDAERVRADAVHRADLLSITTRLMVPAFAIFVLIVTVAGIFLYIELSQANETTRKLSEENAVVIARLKKSESQASQQRLRNRARFQRTDVLFCREIEKLKTGFRQAALESYRRLDETLALLEIERTPEIERAARRNRDDTLKRYAPRPRGCGDIPSSRTG